MRRRAREERAPRPALDRMQPSRASGARRLRLAPPPTQITRGVWPRRKVEREAVPREPAEHDAEEGLSPCTNNLPTVGLADQARCTEEDADAAMKPPAGGARVDEARVHMVFAPAAESVRRKFSIGVASRHDPRHHGGIEWAFETEHHHPQVVDAKTRARVLFEELHDGDAAALVGGKLALKALRVEQSARQIAVGFRESAPRLIDGFWPYVAEECLDVARHDGRPDLGRDQLDFRGAASLIFVALGHCGGTPKGERDYHADGYSAERHVGRLQ